MAEPAITPRQAAYVALAAGAVVAFASFLPWVEVRSGIGTFSVAGTEGSDGLITLAIGGIVALAAFLGIEQPSFTKRGVVFSGGVAAMVFAFWHISQRGGASASIGGVELPTAPAFGLWLIAVAGLVVALAASRMPIEDEP